MSLTPEQRDELRELTLWKDEPFPFPVLVGVGQLAALLDALDVVEARNAELEAENQGWRAVEASHKAAGPKRDR